MRCLAAGLSRASGQCLAVHWQCRGVFVQSPAASERCLGAGRRLTLQTSSQLSMQPLPCPLSCVGQGQRDPLLHLSMPLVPEPPCCHWLLPLWLLLWRCLRCLQGPIPGRLMTSQHWVCFLAHAVPLTPLPAAPLQARCLAATAALHPASGTASGRKSTGLR